MIAAWMKLPEGRRVTPTAFIPRVRIVRFAVTVSTAVAAAVRQRRSAGPSRTREHEDARYAGERCCDRLTCTSPIAQVNAAKRQRNASDLENRQSCPVHAMDPPSAVLGALAALLSSVRGLFESFGRHGKAQARLKVAALAHCPPADCSVISVTVAASASIGNCAWTDFSAARSSFTGRP